MKPKNYWKDRAIKDFISSINKTEDYINNSLENIFKEALKDISKDLEKTYKKFAKDNKLTLEEAKKKLNKSDLRLNGFNEEALKVKSKITKLQLIEMQIQARLSKLHEKEQINLYEHLYNTYSDNYYKTFYEVNKEVGFTLDFNLPHDMAINNAITANWSGKNFSKRIWGRQENTFETIKDAIIKGLTLGSGVDKIVKDLRKRLDVDKSYAKRLVRTETNYAFNKGTLDAYKDSGIVKKYRFLATLDHRTSDKCIALDGKVFNIEKASFGVNYPPIHVNCRSTTAAYFSDYKLKERRYNLGNGEKGTIKYTSYEDWIKSLPINKRYEFGVSKKKWLNSILDKEQYQKYKEVLGISVVGSFNNFQNIKYRNPEQYKRLKSEYRRQLRLF